jgi:hypothetical protein
MRDYAMLGGMVWKKQKSSPCVCGQEPSSRFVCRLLVAADMQRHAHNGKARWRSWFVRYCPKVQTPPARSSESLLYNA